MTQTATDLKECIIHKQLIESGKEVPQALLCNKRGKGIVYRRLTKSGWEEVPILMAWLEEVIRYRDVLSGTDYVKAKVGTDGGIMEFPLMTLDAFVAAMRDYRVRRAEIKWEPLLVSGIYPLVEDAIVSGFICDPAVNVKCGVRDYFNVGLVMAPDPDRAKKALELLDQAAALHPAPDRFWYAVALGAFTAFSFTRRRHYTEAKIVVLAGPPRSGKTTIGSLLNYMFAPNVGTVRLAKDVSTPVCLVRRISEPYALSLPVTLDNARQLLTRRMLAAILKTYASSPDYYASMTAYGRGWPSTPGLVLTANELKAVDPTIESKLALVEFHTQIPPKNEIQFRAVFGKLKETLPHLGGYYLRLAEEHWEDIKRIIVGRVLEEWEYAAVEYMSFVAQQLAYIPKELADASKR